MNLEHTFEIGMLILANVVVWVILAVIFAAVLIGIVNVIVVTWDFIDDIRKDHNS